MEQSLSGCSNPLAQQIGKFGQKVLVYFKKKNLSFKGRPYMSKGTFNAGKPRIPTQVEQFPWCVKSQAFL